MLFLTSPPLPLNPPARLLSFRETSPRLTLQSEDPPSKPNTFWILGPFGVERQLDAQSSVGAYLNLLYKDEGDGETTLSAALGVEYLRYSMPGARGLGYGARALIGDGFAVGPSLFYVTRPARSGVAFRVGATFPIGGGYASFLPELGIGFRF